MLNQALLLIACKVSACLTEDQLNLLQCDVNFLTELSDQSGTPYILPVDFGDGEEMVGVVQWNKQGCNYGKVVIPSTVADSVSIIYVITPPMANPFFLYLEVQSVLGGDYLLRLVTSEDDIFNDADYYSYAEDFSVPENEAIGVVFKGTMPFTDNAGGNSDFCGMVNEVDLVGQVDDKANVWIEGEYPLSPVISNPDNCFESSAVVSFESEDFSDAIITKPLSAINYIGSSIIFNEPDVDFYYEFKIVPESTTEDYAGYSSAAAVYVGNYHLLKSEGVASFELMLTDGSTTFAHGPETIPTDNMYTEFWNDNGTWYVYSPEAGLEDVDTGISLDTPANHKFMLRIKGKNSAALSSEEVSFGSDSEANIIGFNPYGASEYCVSCILPTELITSTFNVLPDTPYRWLVPDNPTSVAPYELIVTDEIISDSLFGATGVLFMNNVIDWSSSVVFFIKNESSVPIQALNEIGFHASTQPGDFMVAKAKLTDTTIASRTSSSFFCTGDTCWIPAREFCIASGNGVNVPYAVETSDIPDFESIKATTSIADIDITATAYEIIESDSNIYHINYEGEMFESGSGIGATTVTLEDMQFVANEPKYYELYFKCLPTDTADPRWPDALYINLGFLNSFIQISAEGSIFFGNAELYAGAVIEELNVGFYWDGIGLKLWFSNFGWLTIADGYTFAENIEDAVNTSIPLVTYYNSSDSWCSLSCEQLLTGYSDEIISSGTTIDWTAGSVFDIGEISYPVIDTPGEWNEGNVLTLAIEYIPLSGTHCIRVDVCINPASDVEQVYSDISIELSPESSELTNPVALLEYPTEVTCYGIVFTSENGVIVDAQVINL